MFIELVKTLTTVKGKGVIYKEPKTKCSKRKITIPYVLVKQLLEYKAWQDEYATSLGDRWENTEFIFTSSTGGRIHPSVLMYHVDTFMAANNLKHYTLHSMRHSNITLQLMNLVLEKVVSVRAGHSRVATTHEIYEHFVDKYDFTAADTMDRIFENIVNIDTYKEKTLATN